VRGPADTMMRPAGRAGLPRGKCFRAFF
jgi:hypothetical protein